MPSLTVYPNPSKQRAEIRYQIPESSIRSTFNGQRSTISLNIYDVSGRLVRQFNQLTNGQSPINQIIWDGSDDHGRKVSEGVYFIRLIVDGSEEDYKKTEKNRGYSKENGDTYRIDQHQKL